MQCGLSKNDIELSWDNLDTQNRKIIDPIANRYMAVIDPVKLSLDAAPEKREVFEVLHPDFPERGKKKIPVDHSKIYISEKDNRDFRGRVVRLKGYCNISLTRKTKCTGDVVIKDMQKIQWVSEPHVKVKIISADAVKEGIGEPEMAHLHINDVIQMERIGFGRIDANDRRQIVVYFSHK